MKFAAVTFIIFLILAKWQQKEDVVPALSDVSHRYSALKMVVIGLPQNVF